MALGVMTILRALHEAEFCWKLVCHDASVCSGRFLNIYS